MQTVKIQKEKLEEMRATLKDISATIDVMVSTINQKNNCVIALKRSIKKLLNQLHG